MDSLSNPRKITQSGGMVVVSIPTSLLDEVGLQKGDRVVLSPTDNGFEAQRVEWEVSDGS